MTDETASRSRVLPPRLDSWLAAGLSLLILSGAALQFGVWEPWEANVSTVAQNMVESGRWLEVNTSGDAEKSNTIERKKEMNMRAGVNKEEKQKNVRNDVKKRSQKTTRKLTTESFGKKVRRHGQSA